MILGAQEAELWGDNDCLNASVSAALGAVAEATQSVAGNNYTSATCFTGGEAMAQTKTANKTLFSLPPDLVLRWHAVSKRGDVYIYIYV